MSIENPRIESESGEQKVSSLEGRVSSNASGQSLYDERFESFLDRFTAASKFRRESGLTDSQLECPVLCARTALEDPDLHLETFNDFMKRNFDYRVDQEQRTIVVACALGECGVALYQDKEKPPLEPIDCQKLDL